jgi:hypothetical protein
VAVALGAALAVLGAGDALAKSGASRADAVAKGITNLQKAVTGMQTQVETTITSLNALAAGTGDMPKLSADFSKQVSKIESMVAKAKTNAEKIKADREAYLAAWEKEQATVTSPELKAAMQARRDELMPIIEKARAAGQKTSTDFSPFLVDLKDLSTYFGADPTASAVAGAKGMVTKCNETGGTLKTSLAELNTAIGELAAKVAPTTGTAK